MKEHGKVGLTSNSESCVIYWKSSLVITLQLLVLVTETEEKERLFNHFSLNDARVYCDVDEASGYNPFEELLRSSVEELYKKRADEKMRSIVTAEIRGEAVPRAEHEEALGCYAGIIQRFLYKKDNLPYSIELFSDQINFIVSLQNIGNKQLINPWNAGALFDLLKEKRFCELRHHIAKFVIFRSGDKFRIYNPETMATAEKMLAEFGGEDYGLRIELERIIAHGKKRIAKDQKTQRRQRFAEEKITANMLA